MEKSFVKSKCFARLNLIEYTHVLLIRYLFLLVYITSFSDFMYCFILLIIHLWDKKEVNAFLFFFFTIF